MYVLILPSWYFEADSDSIAGKNFHALALALVGQGIDARVYFAHYSMKGPAKMQMTSGIEEGVQTYRVRQWFPPKVHKYIINQWIEKYTDGLVNYFSEYGKPDILHAHSYQAAMVAESVKLKTGIPYVYTEHLSDFLHDHIPSAYRFLIKKGIQNADRITAVSPVLKENLLNYVSGNIDVIPNFYNSKIFIHKEVDKHKTFTWVSVGEPAYVKGYDLLIKAFGKLYANIQGGSMQLILIDDIRDKPELEKLARECGVEQLIIWKSLLSPVELADVLQHSHVYISASRYETFGTAMVEAQACGLPVVATRTAGAEYILMSPDQGVLTETESVDSLLSGMRELFLKYSQYSYQKIGQIVFERFNREKITSQWIHLYKDVKA
ncbi:MAG: glycosyltransferase [Bacteroidota bacterium]|nr:glycosyltransferase [Bacteroidota bacterium]